MEGSLFVFRYSPETGDIEGVPLVGLPEWGLDVEGGRSYIWDDEHNISIATFKKPELKCFWTNPKVKIVCGGASHYDRKTGLMIDRETRETWRSSGNVSLGRVKLASEDQQREFTVPDSFDDTDHPSSQDSDDSPPLDFFFQRAERTPVIGTHDWILWPPPVMPSREYVRAPTIPTRRLSMAAWENLTTCPETLPHALTRSDHHALSALNLYLDPPSTSLDEFFAMDHIYVYRGPCPHSTSQTDTSFETVDLFSKVHPSLYARKSTYCSATEPEEGDIDLSGIWLADYYSHGPEFLSFQYPISYTRRLEVMKLTGDTNVPRGEYTFIIPNMSFGDTQTGSPGECLETHSSFLRYAHPDTDPRMWLGKPVFKGSGQLAHHGFTGREWSALELLVIDSGNVPERNFGEVAIVWKELHHASTARRVNVDRLLFGHLRSGTGLPSGGHGEDAEGIVYNV